MKPLPALVALAGAVGVLVLARRALARSAPSSSPASPSPSPAPSPAKASPSSALVYRTSLEAVDVGPWLPLPGASGREIAGPVRATDGRATFARLSYRDALALAAREGARLPTEAEARAWHADAAARGMLAPPCTLPGSAPELAALHREKGWPAPKAGDPRMASEEWARAHDACASRHVRPDYPVGNLGKFWLAGAKPGRSINFGWLLPSSGQYVQSAGGAHDDSHVDYSQLTWLVREERSDERGESREAS